jgi:hypothetical protein
MIDLVISGGQTGADIGGIKAAKHCGLKTAGYMPNGWITQDGKKPEYAELYGMFEYPIRGYSARTEGNVEASDGTIRLARNFFSPGELCTMKFIKKHNKPHLDISIDSLPTVENVVAWIKQNNIKRLNIAGNSEKTAPGIEKIVFDFLCKVFKECI